MFRHDRRELETLAGRLDADRARATRSRVRLARAGRRAFDSKLALLAPLTAGALTGAAALHREPKGGRLSVAGLFSTLTSLIGLVELFRDVVRPALTGGGASDEPTGRPANARLPRGWRPPAPGAVRVPPPAVATVSDAPPGPAGPPRPHRLPPGRPER